MDIKRLKQGDEQEASEVMEIFFPGEDEDKNITAYLSNSQNYLLVAYWHGTAVGLLIGYELQRPETKRPLLFLYEMEVLETQRRLGIGRELVEHFKGIATRLNASEVFLMTNTSNVPATRLYHSTGGIEDGDDNQLFVYQLDDE